MPGPPGKRALHAPATTILLSHRSANEQPSSCAHLDCADESYVLCFKPARRKPFGVRPVGMLIATRGIALLLPWPVLLTLCPGQAPSCGLWRSTLRSTNGPERWALGDSWSAGRNSPASAVWSIATRSASRKSVRLEGRRIGEQPQSSDNAVRLGVCLHSLCGVGALWRGDSLPYGENASCSVHELPYCRYGGSRQKRNSSR